MNSILTKVVIVDDEPQFLELLSQVANSAGFQTNTYSEPSEFWKNSYSVSDVLVLDLSMPQCDGIEFIRELSKRNCEMQIILCSGQDMEILNAAKQLAIAHKLNFLTAIQKPVKLKEFRQILLDSNAAYIKKVNQQFQFDVSADRLSQAIADDEIIPYYQPQVSLTNNKLLGFEALCRWQAPEYGTVPPALFLPIAQEHNLLAKITEKMLSVSTRDIAKLSQMIGKNLHVSVNIDASDVSSLNFPEFIERIVRQAGINTKQLIIEVTESGLMKKLTDSLDILARLRMKGINLSIDDFGTGYSSLSMLHKMPFNELKIDQSFVRTMKTDRTSLAIVETSILLAKKIGVLTVAEGIEDKYTYDLLGDLGCLLGQGYFIGKPMPFLSTIDWYQQWSSNHTLAV